MYIFYNDKLIKEALLPAESQGFQFGYGVFETILVSRGMLCFADLHCQRLAKGCAKLGIQPYIQLEDIINKGKQLSEKLNITEGRLKLICFRDIACDSIVMTLSPYKLDEANMSKGFALMISSIKRNQYSPMVYLKSLNYAENILARDEAKAQGFDEALFLNVESKLCEGAVSNIFWTKGNRLFTPDISSGILEGITRKQVIDICTALKLELVEGSFDLEELLMAEEVFVTNSLMGVMPVCKVDNTIYNISEYKLTKNIYNEYKNLVVAAVSC